jgi:hypothetical protein
MDLNINQDLEMSFATEAVAGAFAHRAKSPQRAPLGYMPSSFQGGVYDASRP